MIRRLKILPRILPIILIGLMGSVAGLPSDTDVVLCFGSDGHVDFSSFSCPDTTSTARHTKAGPPAEREHHQDCIDVEVICGEFDSGYFASGTSATRIGNDVSDKQSTTTASLRLTRSPAIMNGVRGALLNDSARWIRPSRIALDRSTVLLI